MILALVLLLFIRESLHSLDVKCRISDQCVETASHYMRILNVKIRNSESQYRRIQKHLKILGLPLHCYSYYVFITDYQSRRPPRLKASQPATRWLS